MTIEPTYGPPCEEWTRHPLSALFENYDDEMKDEMKRSILECGGLQNPVILLEGTTEVVDGHQRLVCALELISEGHDIDIWHEVTNDPVPTVRAQNLVKRHIPARERARLAIELDNWGVKHDGRKPATVEEIAEGAGVSKRTVDAVKAEQREENGEAKPKKPSKPRKSALERSEDENTRLRAELSEAKDKIQDQEERKAIQQAEAAGDAAGAEKARADRDEHQQMRIKGLEETRDSLKEINSRKQGEIRHWKMMAQNAEKALEELNEETVKLRKQVKDLKSANQSFGDQNRNLLESVSENRQLQEKIEGLTRQNDGLREANDRLRNQRDNAAAIAGIGNPDMISSDPPPKPQKPKGKPPARKR